MIILDTNVISEAMRPDPAPAVVKWLNDQASETLFLTSITLGELLNGIAALPTGKRKDRLQAAFEGLTGMFNKNVLAYDVRAAQSYAELSMTARAAGKGLPLPDAYIAAIAASRGCMVATRDEAPFRAAGLHVINPWSENHAR